MQHTLLPLKERNALRRQYHIRLLIVFCLLISVAGLIGVVALLPSFLKSSQSENAALATVASLKKGKNESGITQIESDFTVSSKLLTIINHDTSGDPLSLVIKEADLLRGPIRLNSFQVSRQSTSTAVLILQGEAPTRNALLALKTRLESASPGNQVDLPVSQLAKSTDVVFSLRVLWTLP